MRLLEDILLRDRYDVIVVGAGLGGLTAGAADGRRAASAARPTLRPIFLRGNMSGSGYVAPILA